MLLVEDNDINKLYAINILKIWDCSVATAENGFVALEKLKNSSFDIVLMDIQMPVMDGFEATKAIRIGEPPKSKIPIIALTANATRKDIEKCLTAGMNDCIAKPFTPDELLRVLIKYSEQKISSKNKVVASNTKSKINPGTVNLIYLKRISNNNAEFIKEMVSTFLSTMPEILEEIKGFTKSESWNHLARALHKIKPSLTMMGLRLAEKLSIQIEQSIKKNQKLLPAQVSKFCEQIENALHELSSVTS